MRKETWRKGTVAVGGDHFSHARRLLDASRFVSSYPFPIPRIGIGIDRSAMPRGFPAFVPPIPSRPESPPEW